MAACVSAKSFLSTSSKTPSASPPRQIFGGLETSSRSFRLSSPPPPSPSETEMGILSASMSLDVMGQLPELHSYTRASLSQPLRHWPWRDTSRTPFPLSDRAVANPAELLVAALQPFHANLVPFHNPGRHLIRASPSRREPV